MQPIVNGLEAEFDGEVVFERRNAATEAGQASLRAYGLRGHPSYVILDVDGEALWTAMGVLEADALRQQIRQFLIQGDP